MGLSIAKSHKQEQENNNLCEDNDHLTIESEALSAPLRDVVTRTANGKLKTSGKNVALVRSGNKSVCQGRSVSRAQSEPCQTRSSSRLSVKSRLYGSKTPEVTGKLTLQDFNDNIVLGKSWTHSPGTHVGDQFHQISQ